jgi:NADH-quinone oxidoreductase subunit M
MATALPAGLPRYSIVTLAGRTMPPTFPASSRLGPWAPGSDEVVDVLYQRGRTYEMDSYGGLAGTAPRFAGLTALAAFASLGLPGFSGFIAELQIFTGSLGSAPVSTAVAFLGILVAAGLFLRAFQKVFLGPYRAPVERVGDVTVVEGVAIAP